MRGEKTFLPEGGSFHHMPRCLYLVAVSPMFPSLLAPLGSWSQCLTSKVVVCAAATSIGEIRQGHMLATPALANSRRSEAVLPAIDPTRPTCNALAIVLKGKGL